MDRRRFLSGSSLSLSALAVGAALEAGRVAKAAASERLRVGCVGAGGRALSLISTFAANREAEVVAIADVDPRRLPQAIEVVQRLQGSAPKTEKDFRKLVDDASLDALVIGTPDHWHAIPTILACLAGKDVYVEKPDAHNIVEGRTMVAAMRKQQRIVQMGSQHRSTKRLQSALDYIRAGKLGRCLMAKAWESARQSSIGRPPDGEPPAGVDYDMWLGSAPKRPFNSNRFHGNWRWFYDYGTGDLGNDGVHRLDMAVAALNAAAETQGDETLALPSAILSSGGKWYFDDAQEFPDTLQVAYEYGGKTPKILTYEMRLWAPYDIHGHSEGAAIYGDQGYLVIGNSGWQAYGPGGKLAAEEKGDSHEAPHVQNFIDCVKSRSKPYCDLETVGHPASVLCHAGNISARVGRKLLLDPESEEFIGDAEANALRTRPEYRKPWELPKV
ncbi:MAG TPA: Gfo/Idh/MocA family oxidoreductase [Pirellulaceae bacterium]|jgi:predicted dehydrogenase|nr:Gfo/Idh/MocA family oxidoreductase [Pirellulaceae bacterium]